MLSLFGWNRGSSLREGLRFRYRLRYIRWDGFCSRLNIAGYEYEEDEHYQTYYYTESIYGTHFL